MNKQYISLPTISAVALWNFEITGQLSDGMWENSKPYDHWKAWNNIEVKLGKPCTNVYARKDNYNLVSLLPIIGERMLKKGRMAKAMSTGFDGDLLYSAEHMPDTFEAFEKGSGNFSMIDLNAVTSEVAKKYYACVYTHKDLRADLKSIKLAMKTKV